MAINGIGKDPVDTPLSIVVGEISGREHLYSGGPVYNDGSDNISVIVERNSEEKTSFFNDEDEEGAPELHFGEECLPDEDFDLNDFSRM